MSCPCMASLKAHHFQFGNWKFHPAWHKSKDRSDWFVFREKSGRCAGGRPTNRWE
jgi:hypothetical protein